MNNGKKSKMKKKSQINDKVKVAVSAEFARKKYKEEDNEGSNTESKCNNKVNKVRLKETFRKYLNMVGENMPVDSSDSSMAKRKRMYIKTYGGGGMVNNNSSSNNKLKVNELNESEFKKRITKDFTYSFNNYLKLKLNA